MLSQSIHSGVVLRALLSAPVAALSMAACSASEAAESGATSETLSAPPGVHAQYGRPQKIGNGVARVYVVLDEKNDRIPLEIGVALSETALEGLPAPASSHGHDAHAGNTMLVLDMPAQNPTPYQFVRLDFNAAGHEPPGIYDIPHFDFHFYKIPVAVMNSIVPADAQYAAKAANLPGEQYRAPFFVDGATAAGAPAAAVTVPQMGLHWLDVRSPELQGIVGKPDGFKPFTKTFIIGTWDGNFIFDEPMITRDYLLAKRASTSTAERDEIIPLSTASQYAPAGFYPAAYRITYDAQAKEYRVALTQLAWRN